jgi:hypothetical protein
MKILGIDLGAVNGGCAIVLVNDGAVPQLIDPIDLPRFRSSRTALPRSALLIVHEFHAWPIGLAQPRH